LEKKYLSQKLFAFYRELRSHSFPSEGSRAFLIFKAQFSMNFQLKIYIIRFAASSFPCNNVLVNKTHSPAAMTEYPKEILVASITPYFLERGGFGYDQNYDKIKRAAATLIWWKENTLFLEENLVINLYQPRRRLVELGYKKPRAWARPASLPSAAAWWIFFPSASPMPGGWNLASTKSTALNRWPSKFRAAKKRFKNN